jgi:hypothetical protein
MKASLRIIVAVVAFNLLAACSSHPAGVSKREWQAMTPEQQATYQRRESQNQRKEKLEQSVRSESQRLQDGRDS